jgi:hypothetical protein
MDGGPALSVFISYSNEDKNAILFAIRHLEAHFQGRCDFLYWGKSQMPGEKDWDSIFAMISQSDVVLPFLIRSSDGSKISALENSLSVGIEVGYALALKKRIIPVVLLSDKERNRLAAIRSHISVCFDYNNPLLLCEELSDALS